MDDSTDKHRGAYPAPLAKASRPHVVFLNRFYAPDIAATGQMLSDVAEDLSPEGWRVSVITGQTGYNRGAAQESPEREIRAGVCIYRVRATRFGQTQLPGRVADYLSYAVLCLLTLLRIPRPDVVVAMSDPPFILMVAVVAARLRGAKVVYWSQDIYPSLAAKLGVLEENGLAFRILESIACWLHARSDLVVGLGPQMLRTLLRHGALPDRTICIHNWADEQAIRPVPAKQNWFVAEHDLEGKFVVLYSGNAGRGHTFDALCETMRRCQGDERIAFIFIGGGKRMSDIRAYAAAKSLSNVRFLDYMPRQDLTYSLSAASVSLVTEDPAVVGLLLPSKIYGILASGRPVIFLGAAESDVAEIVRSAGCGLALSPDDPEALVAAIRRLDSSPSECARMGNAGRRAAENVYSRGHATGKWQDALASLIAPRMGRRV